MIGYEAWGSLGGWGQEIMGTSEIQDTSQGSPMLMRPVQLSSDKAIKGRVSGMVWSGLCPEDSRTGSVGMLGGGGPLRGKA